MTLASITFCGYIVADVVFIVGFVMGKQEDYPMNRGQPLLITSVYIKAMKIATRRFL